MDKSLSKPEFEVGKTYRWAGPSSYSENFSSEMNEWLKGEPHKCTSVASEYGKNTRATFEHIPTNPFRRDHTWDYTHCIQHFVEVVSEDDVSDTRFFKEGHVYRWIGPQDFDRSWNRFMEPWKDGKPRRCTGSRKGHYASFDGIEGLPMEGGPWWYYNTCIQYFEEVKACDALERKHAAARRLVEKWSSRPGVLASEDPVAEAFDRRAIEIAREAAESLPVVNVAAIQQSILDLI